MPGLVDLIDLAQQNTWLMVVLLWLGSGLAYQSITGSIEDLADQQEEFDQELRTVGEQVTRIDQKQDHVVSRQEMILERMGMNAQEIQELQEETARLDEIYEQGTHFYRGSSESNSGD
jgi:chromosome segregation ATPase